MPPCSWRPSPDALRAMRDEGLTIKQIAQRLGKPGSYNKVRDWMQEAGISTTVRKGHTAPVWRSQVKADRSRAVKSQGCKRCPPEQQTECAQAVKEERPVGCEGVLVAGKLVELEHWISEGWWTAVERVKL